MAQRYWLALFCGALCATAAQGQAIETVTVTAARMPEPVGQSAFSVVTLSAAKLAQSDRLDAALEAVPGVSLFRRDSSISANPTTQGISLRAIAPSGAGRALVLLDGVPMNDPFGNWVIWSALPYEDIGRAEIVRGAGTGPYGSGALTGTILLSERSGRGLAVADASAGGLGTARVGASGGAQLGGITLFASASAEHSDGWNPVLPSQRGAADRPLWFNGASGSLSAMTELGG
ncbi:MAG: TonB-dependent receptor plug domain-containing protein, partial [Alphaproteobacteria bacterium]|nr:TonB-dependent receptor plug domain-containing protein [Alphaproteobacteria bacterium]